MPKPKSFFDGFILGISLGALLAFMLWSIILSLKYFYAVA